MILSHWIALAAMSVTIISCSGLSQAQLSKTEELASDVSVSINKVVALGRLEPDGKVIKLSVPNAADSRVNRILVNEGDNVKAGQVIAVLQGFERRQRDLQEAEKTVELFQARLAQLLSGDAKDAEIVAQEANIGRLEARRRNEVLERQAIIDSAEAMLQQAKLTYERNVSLVSLGALSQDQLDQSQRDLSVAEADLQQRRAQLSNTIQTLQEQILQEQSLLIRLQEVRPVDVRVSEVELERAQIAVEQRRADLEDTQVRVPAPGQILRINTRVGEQVNTQQGIVELGQTNQMFAIAEVYETEIAKVKLGQSVAILSEYGGFEGALQGTVQHIGLQVGQRNLFDDSTNPATDENTRVVEVKIQIDPKDSPKVSSLTNLQVRVEIDVAQ